MVPKMYCFNCVALLSIFPFFITFCLSDMGFRQEAARITYYNEKYVTNVSIFTYRSKRNAPYLTTINGTSFQPWGNNITVILEYSNLRMKSDTFLLELKVCDVLKMEWVKDFVMKYADLPPGCPCPVPPNAYHFVGFELPPKNFPLPVSQGDYLVKMKIVTTIGKETIAEMQIILRFQKQNG